MMMDMMLYGDKDWGRGMMAGWGGIHYGLGLITWIALVALAIAATRYLWNKGGKK